MLGRGGVGGRDCGELNGSRAPFYAQKKLLKELKKDTLLSPVTTTLFESNYFLERVIIFVHINLE